VLTAAGNQHDDDHQDHDESDDPEDLHPAWCPGGRFAVGFHDGVGVGGRIGHVRVLLCRACIQGLLPATVYETVRLDTSRVSMTSS